MSSKKVLNSKLFLILFTFFIFAVAFSGVIAKANTKYNPSIGTKVRYPLASGGVYSSPFGPRWGKMHTGVDIAAPMGTPVVAAEDGKVVFTESGNTGYGNHIIIQHKNGLKTLYGHLSSIDVSKGQQVVRGEQIGKVGSTGNSTGPHLHFETIVNGQKVNPMPFINSKVVTENTEAINVKFTGVIKSNAKTIDLSKEDIKFNFSEVFSPVKKEGKTYIDVSNILDSGIFKGNNILVQCAQDYGVNLENKEIIIDREVNQADIQLVFEANFNDTQKGVKTKIKNEFSSKKDDDISVTPINNMFNTEINFGISDISYKNFIVKLNGKELNEKYFNYEDGKLVISHSLNGVELLEISVTKKENSYKDTPKHDNINRINNWIEVTDFDLSMLNSPINGIKFDNTPLSEYSLNAEMPLNKYNAIKENKNEEALINDIFSSGYEYFPNSIISTGSEYTKGIFTEKLDCRKDASSLNSSTVSLVDYKEDGNSTYLILFNYNRDSNIGGYFGVKLNK